SVHATGRPDRMFPWASRSVAKNVAVSPAATTAVSGVTETVATESFGGGGGVESMTTRCAVPLLPSPVAVTSADPGRWARTMTDCPNAPSMRATGAGRGLLACHTRCPYVDAHARSSHRVVSFRRRADRRPAGAARGENRARPGEWGSRGGRDPHAAAARRAAHRDRGGDGARRGNAGAAGGVARPLSRPAGRAGAAARGHAAHRR